MFLPTSTEVHQKADNDFLGNALYSRTKFVRLSVCIPVYNFDVATLVNDLLLEIKTLTEQVELVLIDDCSTDVFTDWSQWSSIPEVLCIQLDENVGRSKIRNLFLRHAHGEYLLFLDGDSLIYTPGLLTNYLQHLDNRPKVICGGRVYPDQEPKALQRLSWKYGVERESIPFEERKKFPNRSFMTNNFLVDRSVLEHIQFDERLTQYGHEDTLFGYELQVHQIEVLHINNPVLNGDIEENEEFIRKTEKGLQNLKRIMEFIPDKKAFGSSVSILHFYHKLYKRRMLWLVKLGYACFGPWAKKRLTKGKVNLRLFDFYKLGYYLNL